jgi:predicted secreted Zn-dependent protease
LTITTNHFMVAGTSPSEIRKSINRARPGGVSSVTDALTTWKINWRTRVTSVDGQCQLDSLTVDTAISITLPNWRPPTNAPPELIKRWSAYYLALLKHELNHAESGRLAARELRRRVLEVPPQADCGTLQRRIQGVADGVIAEYKQRDADYDRETAHGLKEGARLP